MTEIEKKAEEYFEKKSADYYDENSMYTITVKAYEEGYAQGQQELMASNEVVKRGFADNLAKENAELKARADNRLKHWSVLQEENAELKAQIEKMKCCDKCSKAIWNDNHSKIISCNGWKCVNHNQFVKINGS